MTAVLKMMMGSAVNRCVFPSHANGCQLVAKHGIIGHFLVLIYQFLVCLFSGLQLFLFWTVAILPLVIILLLMLPRSYVSS